MPLHDWTRVPAGLYHDFHQSWSIRIKDALNAGRLPKGVGALVEQRAGPREADVLTIEQRSKQPIGSGIATMNPPVTQIVRRTGNQWYAARANRIVVRHHLGRILAVIEIMSPGNKDSRAALREFVDKAIDFLHNGVHLLIIDLFPPSRRDPLGIHKVIWDEFVEEDFAFPAGKSRILASYESGAECTAYVEPLAVGDPLPEMPLFLNKDMYVYVPLESTYQGTWDATLEEVREAVETGKLPDADAE